MRGEESQRVADCGRLPLTQSATYDAARGGRSGRSVPSMPAWLNMSVSVSEVASAAVMASTPRFHYVMVCCDGSVKRLLWPYPLLPHRELAGDHNLESRSNLDVDLHS